MNQLHGHDIEDLSVGMSASFAKAITEADIVMFAGVSGDNVVYQRDDPQMARMVDGAFPSLGRKQGTGVHLRQMVCAKGPEWGAAQPSDEPSAGHDL